MTMIETRNAALGGSTAMCFMKGKNGGDFSPKGVLIAHHRPKVSARSARPGVVGDEVRD
jgi:hypothetical protein